jgi:hypothetical protein
MLNRLAAVIAGAVGGAGNVLIVLWVLSPGYLDSGADPELKWHRAGLVGGMMLYNMVLGGWWVSYSRRLRAKRRGQTQQR